MGMVVLATKYDLRRWDGSTMKPCFCGSVSREINDDFLHMFEDIFEDGSVTPVMQHQICTSEVMYNTTTLKT
jgi:hypothetical protein